MLEKLHLHLKRLSIFLVTAALIAGMVGCVGDGYNPPPSQNLEIRDWYDLDAVRDNLAGHHILMNDLDSTTTGYEELASPTANGGKGWQPIGTIFENTFTGTFDGQGYEICDLFINRPEEDHVGLFGSISYHFVGTNWEGVIRNIGVVNAAVTGSSSVGALMGCNDGIVSNSYCTGNVTGLYTVGGLGGSNGCTVSNCYFNGNVTGYNVTSGDMTGSTKIGGLLGENYGEGKILSNSYSTGSVSGYIYVGGLVGYNAFATVKKCYSTGSVTGSNWAGGLVGGSYIGIVSNSFWDTETSGQTTSAGGTGKNTTEMKDIATFSGAAWNIIAVALNETNPAYIWNIVDNVTYPFLSWQP